MKIDIAKSIQIILMTLFLSISNTVLAVEQNFCSKIFMSHNDTNLSFSSAVYSPVLKIQGRAQPANNQILVQDTSGPISDFKIIENLKYPKTYSYEDFLNMDIGFVVTAESVNAVEETFRLRYNYSWGLEAFSQGFSRRTTSEEKASIQKSDQDFFNHYIDSHRLGYALISPQGRKNTEPFSAFIRVYDGTDYARFGIQSKVKNSSKYKYLLPTEIMFEKNNIKTDLFESYRKQGYQLFQIGKYVLDESLSSTEKKESRNAIFKWLLRNYLDPEKTLNGKVMFVINVDSAAHERTYRNAFGTVKVNPEMFNPPIQEPNSILVVDLQTLRSHLQKLIEK